MKCIIELLFITLANVNSYNLHLKSLSKWRSPALSLSVVSDEIQKEDVLSDIDAKVLKSLLEDDDLISSEESMRRLLIRDEIARERFTKEEKEEEFSDSTFSSSVLRDLEMGKNDAWNALKPKLQNIFQSAGLFVKNRIERDIRLISALGMFAIDRAIRDASRVLPAVATKKEVNMITGNLAPDANKQLLNASNEGVREKLNTAEDEIKMVQQSVQNILSGKSVLSGRGRTLASVAEPGESLRGERMKKAYETRKRKNEKNLNLSDMKKLVDSTYEMKNEMEGEKAGYKTEKFMRGLGQFGQKAILQGRRTLGMLTAGQNQATTNQFYLSPDLSNDVMATVLSRKEKLYNLLLSCIDQPNQTWYTNGDIQDIDESSLTDVTSIIMYYCDILEQEIANESSNTQHETSTEFNLETTEIIDEIAVQVEGICEINASSLKNYLELNTIFLSKNLDDTEEINQNEELRINNEHSSEFFSTNVIDIEPLSVTSKISVVQQIDKNTEEPSMQVEIVMDGEDDFNFNTAQQLQDSDVLEKKNNNAIVAASLRILDIVLYLSENFFTRILPNVLTTGNRINSRITNLRQNGLGYEGWNLLHNVQDASKRY